MFRFVYNKVEDRFSGAGDKAIGGFLFLRFLCPAIWSPEGYLVVDEPVSDEVRRSLGLVTKIIQNLANGVYFGEKEAFMVPANVFVERNQEKLEDFFRELTKEPEQTRATHAKVPKFALANDLLGK
eukprot:TRINITY_DN5474_c0_g2_i3.p4 TRINITY_DN5474_c0_g2~~TRINITY_DN5474_c0_g2_i3.p4  ORF type:complete len:126 (-),score=47.36 TRINITY_DN5474_c0_g2_i3:742-1119(-)